MVISATALTWPVFSAIRAITPGSTSRMKVSDRLGPWTTETPSARSPLGKPIQSASPHARPGPDPVVLERLRYAQVVGVLARQRRVDRAEHSVEDPRQQVAEDQGQEHRDPRPEPGQQDGRTHHERRRGECHPLVLRPVDAGDDGREIEPDQHDDGTGHCRRQDLVDHTGTGEVHEHTHEGQHDARDHDRAGDVGRVAALGSNRGDAGDERGAGARDSWAPGSETISRNRIVHSPENRIARLGSSPITSGNTNVAPNMATTCWAPSPVVLPQLSRWSGATATPGAGSTRSHLNIDMDAPSIEVSGPRLHKLVAPITHPHRRHLPKERRMRWQGLRPHPRRPVSVTP